MFLLLDSSLDTDQEMQRLWWMWAGTVTNQTILHDTIYNERKTFYSQPMTAESPYINRFLPLHQLAIIAYWGRVKDGTNIELSWKTGCLIPANGQKPLTCSREQIVPIKSTIDLFPRTNKTKNTDQTSGWAYRSTSSAWYWWQM